MKFSVPIFNPPAGQVSFEMSSTVSTASPAVAATPKVVPTGLSTTAVTLPKLAILIPPVVLVGMLVVTLRPAVLAHGLEALVVADAHRVRGRERNRELLQGSVELETTVDLDPDRVVGLQGGD